DIISLKNKLVRLENLVNLKLDKEEYQNMEKFVEQTVWSFLYEKEELLVIAVGVVLESCLRSNNGAILHLYLHKFPFIIEYFSHLRDSLIKQSESASIEQWTNCLVPHHNARELY